ANLPNGRCRHRYSRDTPEPWPAETPGSRLMQATGAAAWSRSAAPRPRESDGQYDFPDLFAGIHHGMRIACLFQRKGGVDNGTDFSAFQQRPDMGLERLRDIGFELDRARAQGGAGNGQAP